MLIVNAPLRTRVERLEKALVERVREERQLLQGVAFLGPERLSDDRTGRRSLDKATLDNHRASHPYLHEAEIWAPDVHGARDSGGLMSECTIEDIRAENAALEAAMPYHDALGRHLLAGVDAGGLAVPDGAPAPGALTVPERAALMYATLIQLHPDVHDPARVGLPAGAVEQGAAAAVGAVERAILTEGPLNDDAWTEGANHLMAFVAEHPECVGPGRNGVGVAGVSPSDLFRLVDLLPTPAAPPPGTTDRFVVDLLSAAPPEVASAALADEEEAWSLLRRVWDDAQLRYRVLDLIAAYPPEPPFAFLETYNGVLYNVLRQIRKRPKRFDGVRAVLMRDPLLCSSHEELLLHFQDVIPSREYLLVIHRTSARQTPDGFPVELTF